MRNLHAKLVVGIIFSFLIMSCEREKPNPEGKDQPLIFSSIQANRDTIFTEDTTRIWSVATGYQISYHWFVEKGDLLGSGDEVTFVATPCTVGKNTIFCTIKDGNDHEITKQVVVTVF